MTDFKDPVVEMNESHGPAATVMGSSQLLKDFESRQHSLTRKEAIKEHWKPITWCLYMFFTCVMYGFDSLAGGVVVGITEFRKDFGHPFAGDYVIDADWQLGFQAATLGGEWSYLAWKVMLNTDRHHLWWSHIWHRYQQVRSSNVHSCGIHNQHGRYLSPILLQNARGVFRWQASHWYPSRCLRYRCSNLLGRNGTHLGPRRCHRRHEFRHCVRTTDRIWSPTSNKFLQRRKAVQSLVCYSVGLRSHWLDNFALPPRVSTSGSFGRQSLIRPAQVPILAHGTRQGR
jgi:hypothetical protein